MKAKLILLCLLISAAAYSQTCKVKTLTSYGDTLSILLDFESHLFCHPRSPLINKLNSLYTDYEQPDTCFVFLVPDAQTEFASDGYYVSQHVHNATLHQQRNVRWIEIIRLTPDKGFYLFTVTTNRFIDGKKTVLKTIHFKARCKGKSTTLQFKRKWL